MDGEPDLVNRDPNNLNDGLKISFEEVLGEPDHTHSIDCVWKLSYKCFNLWKNLCYNISTILFGCCIAACWGCEFAEVAFWHIWYITPFFRWLEINCICSKRLYGLCISCMCDPVFESCSNLFSAFKK